VLAGQPMTSSTVSFLSPASALLVEAALVAREPREERRVEACSPWQRGGSTSREALPRIRAGGAGS
jgi:hypothetical protein